MTAPDTNALKRRVLLAGALTVVLWFGTAATIAWLGVSDAWLVIATVLLYVLVTRPLMAPVREAIRLRRRLAYQAWLDEKAHQDEKNKPR